MEIIYSDKDQSILKEMDTAIEEYTEHMIQGMVDQGYEYKDMKYVVDMDHHLRALNGLRTTAFAVMIPVGMFVSNSEYRH